jgi:basic membrane protein A and related proteins
MRTRSRPAVVLAALVALNLALFALGAGRGEDGGRWTGTRIGLVFDVGGIGDKSFNDAAYRGLLAARDEFGVSIRFIEPGDGSDRESALRQLAAAGSDLVLGVGFIFTDDIRKLAAEFPEVTFGCIDFSLAPDSPPPPENLAAVRFREHEGSFLVGAIAGLVSDSKRVGFIGGMDIPLIHKFEAGYRAGVEQVCPECAVMSAYAGTTPDAFSDPVTGKELAITQYNRGADIIFHASGRTGAGVFVAASERGKLAIGVDSDQFHEAPCCVLTSMVKKVDVAVYELIREVEEGRFSGGVRELGLAEDGVGFVYDQNNRHLLPAGVVERVRELERRIIAGEIEVPDR